MYFIFIFFIELRTIANLLKALGTNLLKREKSKIVYINSSKKFQTIKYMPDTVLSMGDSMINKTELLLSVQSLVRKTDP